MPLSLLFNKFEAAAAAGYPTYLVWLIHTTFGKRTLLPLDRVSLPVSPCLYAKVSQPATGSRYIFNVQT